mmetsp:Transcript_76677/g.124060  ORF Transcript_76677/g.124060 Transcript_76677/m.124060 type:complete len:267 (-) Transcript_76677:1705-2505(-)
MNDAGVRIQHPFSETVQVLDPFFVVGRSVCKPRGRSLYQHLCYRSEVLLKFAGDRKRHVPKAGHDCCLDLPVNSWVLQIGVQDLQNCVTVGDELSLQRSAKIAYDPRGHQANLHVVVVRQPDPELRSKVRHKPLEVASHGVGQGGHEQQCLFLKYLCSTSDLLVGRKDFQGLLHGFVSHWTHHLVPQPLNQRSQHAANVALKLALPVHVLEGAGEVSQHLLNERLHVPQTVVPSSGDQNAQCVVPCHSQLSLVGIWSRHDLQEPLG